MKNKSLGTGAMLAALFFYAELPVAAASQYVENLNFPKTVTIVYSGEGAAISNNAGSGVIVSRDGADVAIESSVEGVDYILSGSSSAGSLEIGGAPACKLSFNGLVLTAGDRPAISVFTTNGCYAVLNDGSVNRLSDGVSYIKDIPGAFSSAGALAVSGNGQLVVTVRGEEHGLYSPADIWIRGGDIDVTGAPKDALHAGGTFRMDNGSLRLRAGSDGIDADRVYLNGGSIRIISEEDDVDGLKCDGNMIVNGGNIDMIVKGDSSKGIRCGGNLHIERGSMSFVMSGAVILRSKTNGALVYVDPSYCTGISCDGDMTVNGGCPKRGRRLDHTLRIRRIHGHRNKPRRLHGLYEHYQRLLRRWRFCHPHRRQRVPGLHIAGFRCPA